MRKLRLGGFLETLTTTHLISFILIIVLLPVGTYLLTIMSDVNNLFASHSSLSR